MVVSEFERAIEVSSSRSVGTVMTGDSDGDIVDAMVGDKPEI
jgi:hypothetical protein